MSGLLSVPAFCVIASAVFHVHFAVLTVPCRLFCRHSRLHVAVQSSSSGIYIYAYIILYICVCMCMVLYIAACCR